MQPSSVLKFIVFTGFTLLILVFLPNGCTTSLLAEPDHDPLISHVGQIQKAISEIRDDLKKEVLKPSRNSSVSLDIDIQPLQDKLASVVSTLKKIEKKIPLNNNSTLQSPLKIEFSDKYKAQFESFFQSILSLNKSIQDIKSEIEPFEQIIPSLDKVEKHLAKISKTINKKVTCHIEYNCPIIHQPNDLPHQGASPTTRAPLLALTILVGLLTYISSSMRELQHKKVDSMLEFSKRYHELFEADPVPYPDANSKDTVKIKFNRQHFLFWSLQHQQFATWRKGLIPHTTYLYWLARRIVENKSQDRLSSIDWDEAKKRFVHTDFHDFMESLLEEKQIQKSSDLGQSSTLISQAVESLKTELEHGDISLNTYNKHLNHIKNTSNPAQQGRDILQSAKKEGRELAQKGAMIKAREVMWKNMHWWYMPRFFFIQEVFPGGVWSFFSPHEIRKNWKTFLCLVAVFLFYAVLLLALIYFLIMLSLVLVEVMQILAEHNTDF